MSARPTYAIVCLVLAVVLGAGRAGAATPELRTLFPRQAELHVDSDRLARLVLSPEVIGACRADLSDLRVFDAEDREVPFLIDGGWSPEVRLEIRQSFTPRLLEVSQERPGATLRSRAPGATPRSRAPGATPRSRAPGANAPGATLRSRAPRATRESYRLSAPPEASATGFWDLVIEARQRRFVRRVEVREAGGAALASGSLFRLAEPPREKLELTLPAFSGSLEVVLEGEDGVFLEPEFRYRSARSIPARDRAKVELEELSRGAGDRRTLVELARPRGLVPDLLVLATGTGAFNRPVAVWDEGPGASEGALGQEVVFRVPAAAAVEQLEIPLRPARGDRLRLVIEDGDSPVLEELAVSAVVRRPVLLLALPAPAAGEPSGTLRFGGGRAYRPQYDLAALLPAAGAAAEVAERLYDPRQLGEVRMGPVEANPRFDPSPVLAFAHRAGSAIDARVYRHRRHLDVTPSAEGLARYRLDLDDLAAARPDLADLRIVDRDDRQWAYLLERDAIHEARALTVSAPVTEDGSSTYALALPVAPATVDEVVLETPVPFFDRTYQLQARVGDQQVALAGGRLARRVGDPRPVRIGVLPKGGQREFEVLRVDALELEVADGDDASLPLARVTARFPLAEVFFAAPPGRYWLLLGYPEDRPPSYELARVRDVVLAVATSEATAGALEDNPDYRARSRLAGAGGLQRLALWVVLGAAVLGLALLTLRLARQVPPPGV